MCVVLVMSMASFRIITPTVELRVSTMAAKDNSGESSITPSIRM